MDLSPSNTGFHCNFFFLFSDKTRFFKYLRCIVIGIPLWYVVGILITLSPEFGKALAIHGDVNAGIAVACCYGGLVFGDIASGLLSQLLKSRVKVVSCYLLLSLISMSIFFLSHNVSLFFFYSICLFMGFSVGYWVIFMTIATEQFGTNIRATVTTTAPNFVRGAVVPLSFLLQFFQGLFNGELILAAIVVGIMCMVAAFFSLSRIDDSFSKDLDYLEV